MNHQVAGHEEVPGFDLTFFKTIRFHTHCLDAATVENVKPLRLDGGCGEKDQGNGQQRSESKHSRLVYEGCGAQVHKKAGLHEQIVIRIKWGIHPDSV